MVPKLLQNLSREAQRERHEQPEVDGARMNPKGSQFDSRQLKHRYNQIGFHSQSDRKIINFEYIETCSHSELSLVDEGQRLARLQSCLYHKVGRHGGETSQGIELWRRIEGQADNEALWPEGGRILRTNSNSMQMGINWYQTQQIHTNDKSYRNAYPTQKTIILQPSSNHANSNQNLQQILNSLTTVKNLNKLNYLSEMQAQKIAVSKQYYLDDINTKYNLQDLDNKSSCSSEHRQEVNEIWDRNQYEINQIEGLRERETYSSSCESEEEQQNSQGSLQRLQAENKEILKINNQLRCENQQLKNELASALQRNKIHHQELEQYILVKDQNSEKYEQLQLQNKQLNDLILDYKREAYNSEVTLKQLTLKIASLEQELHLSKRKLEQTEDHIAIISSLLDEKNQEIEDYAIVNRQLQEFIGTKGNQYEQQIEQLQREINRLKDTVEFYKERLQQEGFTFNLEEIKRIQDILEFQADQEQQTVVSLSKSYQQQLNKLQHQNKLYAFKLSNIEQQSSQICSNHYKTHFNLLQSETEAIIKQYDTELQARDEEILGLKQQLLEIQQLSAELNLNGCRKYIQRVDKLSQIILSQKIERYSSSQLVIQFVYVVDKVTKMFLAAGKQNQSLRKDNIAWKKIVEQKDVIYSQQVQTNNQKISQLQTEICLLKSSNAQLKSNISAITTRQQLKQKQRHYNKVPIGSFDSQKIEAIIQREEKDRILQPIPTTTPISTLQLLLSNNDLNPPQKMKLACALLSFAQRIVTQNKKRISLKPKNLKVISNGEYFEVELMAADSARSNESQKSLIYCAPEVLLGFSQSQVSYVWTIGLAIDYLFHSSMFYKKLNQVTCRAENYYCRDQRLAIRSILQSMMKKKQKERCTLQQALSTLVGSL